MKGAFIVVTICEFLGEEGGQNLRKKRHDIYRRPCSFPLRSSLFGLLNRFATWVEDPIRTLRFTDAKIIVIRYTGGIVLILAKWLIQNIGFEPVNENSYSESLKTLLFFEQANDRLLITNYSGHRNYSNGRYSPI